MSGVELSEQLHKNKPRLLIILNRFVIGGQAVDTLPLAYYLQKDFDVLILYGEKEKDEVEPAFLLHKYKGLILKRVKGLKRSVNPLQDFAAFFQILKVLLHFKPAIVHTHGAKSGLLGRVGAFFCGVPVIVHTFHGHLFHSYFSRFVSGLLVFTERCLSKITSGCIVLSTSQWNDLVKVFKVFPEQKVEIIPLGFDDYNDHNGAALRQVFREKYSLRESDVAIGIVGRIVPVKNHPFFIEVVSKLLKIYADSPPAFFIIGDGELKETLESQLENLHIPFSTQSISSTTRIVFTSWLTDIGEVMSGLDIVALTSVNEGTPLSIIEAQAFGKPVVATNVGGVRDTMVDEETGFYVDKNDLETFCEKSQALIEDAGKRRKMGEAGKRFVAERFSKQREVDMTSNFYFSLLAKTGFKG
jgi:glycosyltransferase involved in cell wall biosynthesis